MLTCESSTIPATEADTVLDRTPALVEYTVDPAANADVLRSRTRPNTVMCPFALFGMSSVVIPRIVPWPSSSATVGRFPIAPVMRLGRPLALVAPELVGPLLDGKRVVEGKSVYVGVDLGGGSFFKKKN